MAELRVCVLEMGLSDASIERQDENTSSETVHVTHSHGRGGSIYSTFYSTLHIIYHILYKISDLVFTHLSPGQSFDLSVSAGL